MAADERIVKPGRAGNQRTTPARIVSREGMALSFVGLGVAGKTASGLLEPMRKESSRKRGRKGKAAISKG